MFFFFTIDSRPGVIHYLHRWSLALLSVLLRFRSICGYPFYRKSIFLGINSIDHYSYVEYVTFFCQMVAVSVDSWFLLLLCQIPLAISMFFIIAIASSIPLWRLSKSWCSTAKFLGLMEDNCCFRAWSQTICDFLVIVFAGYFYLALPRTWRLIFLSFFSLPWKFRLVCELLCTAHIAVLSIFLNII